MKAQLVFPITALLLATSCTGPGKEEGADSGTAAEPEAKAAPARKAAPDLTPIVEGFLRFDGVYHAQNGQVDYFIRFFPQGNAVMLAGFPDAKVDLRSGLKPDMPEGFSNGHNVPVRIEGDSILFSTSNMKGDISYHGFRTDPEHINFRKHSHINGREAEMEYVFESYP
ncbi:MAG: hypothetical protein H6595_01140 [Flavobacteriales bacterium]|nr:hypothetical protein [Flavobacteriales bacterium]MCB9166063.1 hypothetical protein [Flavobacteriales bacterium]